MFDNSQLDAIEILHRGNGGVVWHKVGEGKTRICLGWFAKFANDLPKGCNLLAVVTRRKSFSSWVEEASMVCPDFRVMSYEDWSGISTRKPTVVLISHGILHQVERTLTDGRFEAIVYDEGYKMKNPKSRMCKAACRISSAIVKAAIMGGSVMTANNIVDIWGQLYAIARHSVLCRTLTQFRSKFMRVIDIAGIMKFVPRMGAQERIRDAIKGFTSTYFPSDRIKTRDTLIDVNPTEEQMNLLLQARDYLFVSEGEVTELKHVISLIIKVSQISDGFFVHRSGSVTNLECSKLDALKRILSRCVKKSKVVIWVAFRLSVRRVLQELQSEFKCYTMYGGKKFDEAGWARDGQVAIATVGSGDSVNFFKNCSTVIYYSRDFKGLNLRQSRGRTLRKDSQHTECRYYHLMTSRTFDYEIKAIAEGSIASEDKLRKVLTSWASGV